MFHHERIVSDRVAIAQLSPLDRTPYTLEDMDFMRTDASQLRHDAFQRLLIRIVLEGRSRENNVNSLVR